MELETLLGVLGTNGNDEASAGRELGEQRRGHVVRRRGDDDDVNGAASGQPR